MEERKRGREEEGAVPAAPPPVALVTGGARRIGAEIVRVLARAGFRVLFTYRASRGEAAALAAGTGGRALRLDLARPAGFPAFASRVEAAEGRLDLLVHNAALFPRTPLDAVSEREWDAVFDVNLRAPFLLTRALLPLLRKGGSGGAVLFVGDAGARRLWPGYLPYCLSKLALEAQARAFRSILSPGIRVGLVRPGLALPPDGFPPERWEALRKRRGPRGPASPDAVARAVLRFARNG